MPERVRRRAARAVLCATAAVLAGTTVLTGAAGLPAAQADPAPQPPDPAVPTADQVAGLLSRLTDPTTPDPAKAALVQGGLTPDVLGQIDQNLTGLDRAGSLPFAIDVTDIQPAPDDYAGVTVSITGHHIPIPVVRPMVLVKQGDSWLFTHDSVDPTLTGELAWIADRVDGRHIGGGFYGGPPLPPFSGGW